MRGFWFWLPWVICAVLLIAHWLLAWRAGHVLDDSLDQAYDDGFETGQAARDDEVRSQLWRGFVLRSRADGSPVWVRDQRMTEPAVTSDDKGSDGDERNPVVAEPAPVPDVRDEPRADRLPGKVAMGGDHPDWRQQVTADLTALTQPGSSHALTSQESLPPPRTPWMRDKAGEAVGAWESFEHDLAAWAARIEEEIEA
jgi:hypothetical protein